MIEEFHKKVLYWFRLHSVFLLRNNLKKKNKNVFSLKFGYRHYLNDHLQTLMDISFMGCT